MATPNNAVSLAELPVDEVKECLALAKTAAQRAGNKRDRTDQEVERDFFDGYVAERQMALLFESKGRSGCYRTCVSNQMAGHAMPGPDFADVDNKVTRYSGKLTEVFSKVDAVDAETGETLVGRLTRRNLWPTASALGPKAAPKFTLVINTNEGSFFVGWATKEEVLASKDRKVPLHLLHDPQTVFQE